MVRKAAPGSGLGQRFKRLLAQPVAHNLCPGPAARRAAVLPSALSLVKASWLNFTALIHSRENPTAFSRIWLKLSQRVKLRRIYEAEGFIEQSQPQSLPGKHSHDRPTVSLAQCKWQHMKAKPRKADGLVLLQIKGDIYFCKSAAVHSQYVSVFTCT